MKKFKRKALVIAAMLGAVVSFNPSVAPINPISPIVPSNVALGATSINVSVEQRNIVNDIDWSHGANSVIVAEGRGRSNGKGISMARLAAITDAQRHLLGIIKGVQIDADTLMLDLMIENDTVRSKVSGLLRGAVIIEEHTLGDEEYSVKMCIPLYGPLGSLASVVVPEIMDGSAPDPFPNVDPNTFNNAEMQSIRDAHYTGVVINADGMDMSPTFSPVIYDTSGRAIYGVDNLDYDTVIEKGMVDYANDMNGARLDNRAGSNPLVIDAVDVRGGQNSTNKVNAVVSVEDANKILVANEATDMLEDTSVVFVK
ncbi:MAG: hypothetical protein IJ668_06740 [Selenomonadaceae bacterium]|nr:hypothetical protein [Selenomonadaceae bacterium]